ncbi:MAG: YdcF family protein [Candidatus Moranbacteria bacterium]|nr:YdcF family protein [Candidatus Moranbacteria bacterium]
MIIGRDEPYEMSCYLNRLRLALRPLDKTILTDNETFVLLNELGPENQKEHIMKVALVLTAGVKSKMFWGSFQLPFFCNWPTIKWFGRLFGWKLVYLDQLKTETVCRLEKAYSLFQNGVIGLIFVSGGGKTNSAKLMKDWLTGKGLPPESIRTDDKSVSTATNVAAFAGFIKNLDGFGEEIVVFLVSSWYHTGRARKFFEKILRDVTIIEIKAYPPLSWECLKEEYLYNLLSEPFKRLVSLSSGLLGFFDKIEKASR